MSHIRISCAVPYWRCCSCGPHARTIYLAHGSLPCYFWKGPMQELGGFLSTVHGGHNYSWEFEWVRIVAFCKGKQG